MKKILTVFIVFLVITACSKVVPTGSEPSKSVESFEMSPNWVLTDTDGVEHNFPQSAEYLAENGYNFTLFTEAEEIAKLYEIKGTPGVLVIDEKGQIRFDLRDVPSIKMKPIGKKHWQKAMQTAPYWGSELRKALDTLKKN